jgi:hypothetical protein
MERPSRPIRFRQLSERRGSGAAITSDGHGSGDGRMLLVKVSQLLEGASVSEQGAL